MQMAPRTCIASLKLINEDTLLVKLDWDGQDLDALLINYYRQTAWNGKVVKDDLEQFSTILDMPLEDYIQELYNACSAKSPSPYSASFENSSFVLKKHHDGVSIKLIEIAMQEGNFAYILPLVTQQLLSDNTSLMSETSRLQNQCRELSDARDRLLKRLEETADIKTQVESQLFAEFLPILNAKKEKIAELLAQQQSKVDSKAATQATRSSSSSTSAPPLSFSPDGAYDEDTDVETDEETSSKRARKVT